MAFLLFFCLLLNNCFATPFIMDDPASKLVNSWYKERKAAGNYGDFYDNRDRGHAQISLKQFPQLSKVKYTSLEEANNIDWAGQRSLLPFVVIGNSSTASGVESTGGNVRSLYYLSKQGMQFLYMQYRYNNLYVYPAHKDHTPSTDLSSYGDTYPTNSPYVVISQGSSGSDIPFIKAFFQTLAAFKPFVKNKLIENKLLMPTLQQIFRRSNTMVKTDQDYLTGKAHPTVFEPKKIDAKKMVLYANQMDISSIPPLAQLEVIQEKKRITQALYPNKGEEILATTPCAIARVIRSFEYQKSITVSAKESFDIENKKLSFKWRILRGDPNKISIKLNQDKSLATITVDYHKRFLSDTIPRIPTNRVDIALFADNGKSLSAPAMITFFFLDTEIREYQNKKLVEINFNGRRQGIKIQDIKKGLQLFLTDPLCISMVTQKEKQTIENLLKNPIKQEDKIDKLSVNKWLIQKFNRMAKNHQFFNEKKEFINTEITQKQMKFNIFFQSMKKYIINPRTTYEKYMAEKFNLILFSEYLYPSILSYWEKQNFVDERLSKPYPGRYIYSYEQDQIKREFYKAGEKKEEVWIKNPNLS